MDKLLIGSALEQLRTLAAYAKLIERRLAQEVLLGNGGATMKRYWDNRKEKLWGKRRIKQKPHGEGRDER